MIETPFQGSLFAVDFLKESIRTLPEWEEFDDARLERLNARLQEIFLGFPAARNPNEAQTEDDLIWPILEALGWRDWLRQQNLATYGRDDVPDGLLFVDAGASFSTSLSGSWLTSRPPSRVLPHFSTDDTATRSLLFTLRAETLSCPTRCIIHA